MIDYEAAVMEFQKKYRHFIPDPSVEPHLDIDPAVYKLRIDLIQEEYKEIFDALEAGDIAEFADGVADLIYVLVGACIALSIPINRVFQEVHRSNMTKTPPSEINDAGKKYGTKTPKGKDYIPPDISGILFRSNRQTKLEEVADGIS